MAHTGACTKLKEIHINSVYNFANLTISTVCHNLKVIYYHCWIDMLVYQKLCPVVVQLWTRLVAVQRWTHLVAAVQNMDLSCGCCSETDLSCNFGWKGHGSIKLQQFSSVISSGVSLSFSNLSSVGADKCGGIFN